MALKTTLIAIILFLNTSAFTESWHSSLANMIGKIPTGAVCAVLWVSAVVFQT